MTPRKTRILAAVDAEIARLQSFRESVIGNRFDWWDTDLVDWFEPDEPLYLADADDGGEHLPTRVYYRVGWDRDDDGRWTVVAGVERMHVFVALSEYMPDIDVTALLSEDMLAGYRDAACVDAAQKLAWKEAIERASAEQLARME